MQHTILKTILCQLSSESCLKQQNVSKSELCVAVEKINLLIIWTTKTVYLVLKSLNKCKMRL